MVMNKTNRKEAISNFDYTTPPQGDLDHNNRPRPATTEIREFKLNNNPMMLLIGFVVGVCCSTMVLMPYN